MRGESPSFLRAEGASAQLLDEVLAFRKYYKLEEAETTHVPVPLCPYRGREVWKGAIGILPAGEHLLLTGGRTSDKDVLAEGLTATFGHPLWDTSLYANTDATSLIRTGTFQDDEIQLRRGPMLRTAECDGFGVLDEISMTKNKSLVVLRAALNFRRVIDIPGYDRVRLHETIRFIGTMNCGYTGTRELSEALAPRFLVIQMPVIPEADVQRLLPGKYPTLRPEYTAQFAALFDEIREKSESGEITGHALDLCGMVATVSMTARGLSPVRAPRLGVVSKCFDNCEQALVGDLVAARLPESLEADHIFV